MIECVRLLRVCVAPPLGLYCVASDHVAKLQSIIKQFPLGGEAAVVVCLQSPTQWLDVFESRF